MLLDALSTHGVVHEVAPGRIEVDDGTGDVLTVVVRPDQWARELQEEEPADVDLYIAELVGPRDEDETFVVFHDGRLARSTREELPPVAGQAFARELAAIREARPEARLGWYAFPPEGSDLPEGPEPS